MFSCMKLTNINNREAASSRPRLLLTRVCCLLLLLLFMGTKAFAAGYQPDLMVRLASAGDATYLGAGVFESVAVTQSKSQPAFPGSAAQYRVLLRNAGDTTDRFLLQGTGSGNGITVRYLDDAGMDLSAAISGAGYDTVSLGPGQSVSFLVQVTPASLPLGASFRVTLTASSASDNGKLDQVKTETVACSLTAAVTVTSPPDSWGFPGSVVNYPYTVTNVGNSGNTFSLSAADSTSWPSSIYADDGAGGGIAGDGVRQSGENHEVSSTGPLAPGESYRFFLAVTVPETSADRAHSDSHLAVTGAGASASDQVTTSAIAAVITVAENVRNLNQGGAFAVNANAVPGDTLEYRMTITNSGSAPATSVGIDNPLPVSTVCLPGSLWIGTSPGGDGTPCAAPQCGWVRESAGSVVARLGQGATEAAGGTLSPGKTLYVYFRVQVE
jgi:uncharacterized repeat protein (TIGR01451 family)